LLSINQQINARIKGWNMRAINVDTFAGNVNVVVEHVEAVNWYGANWVVFIRHSTALHIAFAYDGTNSLIDALRCQRALAEKPFHVGLLVSEWQADINKANHII